MTFRLPSRSRSGLASLVVAASVLAATALVAGREAGGHQTPGTGQSAFTPPPAPVAVNTLARDIYRQLIEINTTESTGGSTRAAEAMAARLLAGGFAPGDVQILGPNPRKQNLVARYRGTGSEKPLLLLGHLDVVEARREDWSIDPFTFIERDGYFYGRGTSDMKDMDACWVANLLELKREGYKPTRDIILALTADEENGDANGAEWLLRTHPKLVDAGLALNEGGGGQIKDGRYVSYSVQAAEKVYQSFSLEARNKGGHSSLPSRDNAIYHLAAGLTRLSAFDFPIRLNEVTRAYFERMSRVAQGDLARDMRAVAATPPDMAAANRLAQEPYFNALMRTTCVPTLLQGGHAENALPQMARAVVNCRMLPDDTTDNVMQAIVGAVADKEVVVTPVAKARPGPASPLSPALMGALDRVAAEMWPGVPVVPVMGTGATDGKWFRMAGIATYGLGAFENVDDIRAHGRDERMGVKQFYEQREFLYRLIKALTE
jgi:acetylornithine deacetylase/succinyl-diaminopimelate desuccinylase-like protein